MTLHQRKVSGIRATVAHQDGGRLACRQLCFPENVLLRAELGRQLSAAPTAPRATGVPSIEVSMVTRTRSGQRHFDLSFSARRLVNYLTTFMV